MLYPYLNQLAISLNDGMDTILGVITIFPRKFTWTNYETILNSQQILRAFILTVVVSVAHTFLSLFITMSAAYAMSKKELPFRNAITWIFIIPGYVGGSIITSFILYRYLGLLNNPLVFVAMHIFQNIISL